MADKIDRDKNGNSESALRHRAEGKLSRSPDRTRELKEKASEEIIHELHVHQIELEVQNEELKRVQLELDASRSNYQGKYQDLYDFAPVGYLTLTHKGIITGVNLTGASILAMPRPKLIGRGFGRFVAPESLEEWYKHIVSVLRHERKQSCDLKLKREDGSTFYARVESIRMAAPVEPQRENNDGHELRIAVTDITERKMAEESQKLLSAAIEHTAEGIVITDATGIIQYVNPAEEIISGYSRDELIGQGAEIFKSDKHDEDFHANMWETIRAGKVWSGRFINKKKDGTEYHEDSTISPVYDKSGKLTNFIAVKRDVTQKLALQEQLFQAQKMESIGTLADGFAHDFNNSLQVIDGCVDLILSNKDLPATVKSEMEVIKETVDSSAELIKGMMVFSRKAPVKFKTIELNKVVAQTRSMLIRSIPKVIEIDILLADDLWATKGDKIQIGQILMNLGINARDAMPDGGKITVQTQNTILDEEYRRFDPLAKPGRYALLTVSDTGAGMDKEKVSHIFEPFFSTKEAGKGTGLGLSVVYGIVEKHNGRIICDSELSVGTTFRIYFPAIEQVPQKQYAEKKEPPKGKCETILVVDDEPNFLEVTSRLLNRANYRVITASNGKDALKLYGEHRKEIRLVILDLLMPEMNGKQCLEALRNIDPKVRVLIATGNATQGMAEDLKAAGARRFIKKPFDIARLLEKIRKVIDEG
jgi:two-component system cell cycle sensor histidine kinase/response regulator CckA